MNRQASWPASPAVTVTAAAAATQSSAAEAVGRAIKAARCNRTSSRNSSSKRTRPVEYYCIALYRTTRLAAAAADVAAVVTKVNRSSQTGPESESSFGIWCRADDPRISDRDAATE